MKKMSKIEAVSTLLTDAATHRGTNASARRVLRACRSLRLEDKEIREVFGRLEYCNMNGDPYSSAIKRIWP